MAGKGGGAWKVAYADFVTAMMAFFLVMWITAQNQQVKEAIADHFTTPFGWSEARGGKNPVMINGVQRKAIATDRPPEKNWDSVRSKTRRFEDIATTIHFDDGASDLDEKAQETLQRIIPHLAGKLQRIEVRGHSSRKPSTQDNEEPWELCYARCLETVAYLKEQGISEGRIRISLAGGNEPASEGEAPSRPNNNSRVEVLLLSEFVRAPQ